MRVATEENKVLAVRHLVAIVVLKEGGSLFLLKDPLYRILKLPPEGKLLSQNLLKLNRKGHKIQVLGPCDCCSAVLN